MELKNQKSLSLKIHPTEDVIASVAREKKSHQKVIAFALENAELAQGMASAREKLKHKFCDAIILNLAENILSDSTERYEQWLIAENLPPVELEAGSKSELADQLVEALEDLLFQERPSRVRRSTQNLDV